VDYSHAPERARQLCAAVPHAHFIRADVNHLPFHARPQFDFILSHGVLHHTPNTRRSFANLPPLLREHGEIYIAVFRKTFGLLRWSDAAIRTVVNKLPVFMQERFCRALLALQGLPAASFWKRFFWFSLQKDP
jgi:SAM-dependent methyltransferase